MGFSNRVFLNGDAIVTIKTINQAITLAHRRADETGLVYAVVELDHEEGRVIRVVLFSSTEDDDFESCCGEVLYVTEGDEDE
jgi:hypothetical protein